MEDATDIDYDDIVDGIIPAAKRIKTSRDVHINDAAEYEQVHIIPYICAISIDSLAHIIRFIDKDSVIIDKLVFCGNRQLNHMMENGAIKKLCYSSVNSNYFKRSISMYERFAKNLRSLRTNFSNSQVKSLCSIFQQMKQLQRLSLSCYSINDLVVPLFPKSLKSLSLSYTPSLSHECVADLPRSLTYLGIEIDLKSNLRYLPPGLEYLYCPGTCISRIHLSLLPRTLSTLRVKANSDWNCKDSIDLNDEGDYLNFPPNLTDLGLLGEKGVIAPSTRHFPKSLRKLSLNGVVGLSQSLSHLPRTLAFFATNQDILDDSEIAHLPGDLKHLDVGYKLSISHSVLQKFSVLVQLSMSHWGGSDHDVSLLPRSLKHIEFHGYSHLGCVGASNLPRGLTWLRMGGKLLTDKGVALLPRGLTYLSLQYKGNRSDKAIKNLPRTLTDLKMEWNCKSMTASNGFLHLPRNLTRIDWNLFKTNIDFHQCHLANLPTTLKELRGCNKLELEWKVWKSAKK